MLTDVQVNPCLMWKKVINTMCGHGMQDLDYLAAKDYIYTNGCIDKLVNWIHSNLFLLGGVALGFAIPQLVGILLSQILINQIKDQIELQKYNSQHRADPCPTHLSLLLKNQMLGGGDDTLAVEAVQRGETRLILRWMELIM
eukprot:g44771.t1